MPQTSLNALLAAGALFAATTAFAAAPTMTTADDQAALSMTVYQQGLALIRDERTVDIPLGRTQLGLTDISNQLMTESIMLTGQGLALHGYSYTKASLSSGNLLDSHIGQTIQVLHQDPRTGNVIEQDGVLVGVSNGSPIVDINGRIEIGGPGVPWWIAVDAIPPELQAKESLILDLDNQTRGPQSLSLVYLSRGLSWQANYTGQLSADNTLNLSGWVSVDNNSNTQFTAARVQLLAGDINQASGYRPMMAMARAESAPADMASNPIEDYHLYDLPETLTLLPNQRQQVRLLANRDVPVEREYRIESDGSRRILQEETVPVSILLHLDNKEPALGLPLPAGIVRIFSDASQGSSQFLGEDRLGHTAKDQSLTLRVGRAFDISGKKTTTSFRRIDNKTIELEQKILLSNAKNSAAEVLVAERLPGDWEIIDSSDSYEKASAMLAEWRLEVPANSERELKYHVRIRH